MENMPVKHALMALLIILLLTQAAATSSPGGCFTLQGHSSLQKYQAAYGSVTGVPAERLFWEAGAYPVVAVTVGGTRIDWPDAAYHSLWSIPVLVNDSSVSVFGHTQGGPVCVKTSYKPAYSTMDIAPTALEALGLGGDFDGRAIVHENASQVIIIYVDSLGWYRYRWAMGAAANISSLSPPLMASSVYPSISNINAAAMATGVRPERNGVDVWENRTILVPTGMEISRRSNVSAAWIDGPSPSISADGIARVPGTDDDVMDGAIAEYENGSRLLYVHVSGPDRALHVSGPYSEASLGAIRHADELVGKMLAHVKPGTLVIIVADHGGHEIEGGKGDHGSLLPEDLLVPVFIRYVW
jgi:hypothetical protein